jgi:hypothetical protein
MRTASLLSLPLLLVSVASAQAGLPVPGPVIGDSIPGLVVLIAVVGGYFLFRQLRARKT